MIIDATCSKCKRAYRLPDTQVGKRVRCKGCGDVFVVVAEEEVPILEEASDADVRRAAKKQREEQAVEVLDDVEEFEEEEERVVAAPKRRTRSDDDEEDDRVSATRSRRSRRDEDEDDRPRRSRRDDDEDDDEEEEEPEKKGGGGVLVVLGIVAAVLLLLCGGGGGLAYYASRKAADNAVAGINDLKPDDQWKTQPGDLDKGKVNPPNDGGKINNPPNQDGGKINNPPNNDNQPPRDVNAALAMLKENDAAKKRLALQFLNTAAIESSRVSDVEKAVGPLESDVQFLDDAGKVLDRWAPSGRVERLAKLLESNNSTVYRSAMDRLSRIKEDRAAEVLAGQLVGRGDDAARYLPNMGKLCEKYVLVHYNSLSPAQTPARQVLDAIGTTNEVRVKQCLADFEATAEASDDKFEEITRQQKRTAIMNTLQKLKPTKEIDLNEQVSKSMEGLLAEKNPLLVDGALKAMETWMVKDSVPAVIQLARKDDLKRGQAIKLLKKYPDHESVPPFLVELFLDNRERNNAAQALIAMGGKGEKAILDAKTWVAQQRDVMARRMAYHVLAAVGTRASIQPLRDFATVESRGGDKKNQADALAAIKVIQAREKLPIDKNPPKDKVMPKDKPKIKDKIK